MKKSTKTEIVLATWKGRSGPSYLGDQDHGSHDNLTASLWLLLRGVVPNDPYGYMNDDCRAIGDIGLYILLNVDGTVSIDLRLHDLGSLTSRESVERTTILRRLFAKGKSYPFNGFVRNSDVDTELVKVIDALWIHRTLVYKGINIRESFEPVGMAIKRIADNIGERLEGMRLRQVA